MAAKNVSKEFERIVGRRHINHTDASKNCCLERFQRPSYEARSPSSCPQQLTQVHLAYNARYTAEVQAVPEEFIFCCFQYYAGQWTVWDWSKDLSIPHFHSSLFPVINIAQRHAAKYQKNMYFQLAHSFKQKKFMHIFVWIMLHICRLNMKYVIFLF